MALILVLSEYQASMAEYGQVYLTADQAVEILERGFDLLAGVLVEERVNLKDLAGISYAQLRKDMTRVLLGRLRPLDDIPF